MPFGSYLQFQRENPSKNYNFFILTSTTTIDNAISPKSANHQLWIQKLVFYETTESNGKSITFGDDSSTSKVLGVYNSVTAAAGVPKSLVLDFGPTGIPLGVGKNLDITISAAGIAGALHIEAYERLVGPVAPATTN